MKDANTSNGLLGAFGPRSVDEMLRQFRNPEPADINKSWPPKAERSSTEPAKPSDALVHRISWLGAALDMHEPLAGRLKPLEYVLSPLIPAGRTTLFTGLGSSSKSTSLKTMAVGVCTGKEVLGLTVARRGRAVLISAEDTADDALRSIAGIIKDLNLTDEEMAALQENLILFPAAGRDCVILNPGSGSQSPRLTEIVEFIAGIENVRLIGFDPAIAFTSGRELDELAQRELATRLEELAISTGAAVVLISHAAKSIQYQQALSSHNSRGSGALTDAVRLEITFRNATSGAECRSFGIPEDDRYRYVRMQVTKANFLPPDLMKPIWLERVDGGALRVAKLMSASQSGSSRHKKALELFLQVDQASGEITSKKLLFKDWKSLVGTAHILPAKTSTALDTGARRLLSALIDLGYVTEEVGMYEITPEGIDKVSG